MSKRRERDASQRKQTVDGEGKDMKTIRIPYIKGTSEAIRRVLGPLGIRTAMRSTKMKWSILQRVKDKLVNQPTNQKERCVRNGLHRLQGSVYRRNTQNSRTEDEGTSVGNSVGTYSHDEEEGRLEEPRLRITTQ